MDKNVTGKNNENSVIITAGHRGEVHEKRCDFDKSLFHRVYQRSYMIVQEYVDFQLERKTESNYQENVDNIVTFMGRRGTGKSSAMLSFMKGLRDNCNEECVPEKYTVYNKKDRSRKVNFISIDWIDASLLEKGEDIFEAILAKMLIEFLKEDEKDSSDSYSYEMRDLYNEFANIYQKHLKLKQRSQDESFSIETAVSNLRALARSAEIKGKFQELVKRYVQLKSHKLSAENARDYETFLVIAIDDIDMNIESGFEILEKIQRYLKIERLIILVAVNHEQMKLCCEKHFAEVFIDSKEDYNDEKKKYAASLADQYMEKVIPSYARVYLPSLKKMDYDRNRVTNVTIRDKMGHDSAYPIKQAMFILARNKTFVRYDSEGMKRHFMEPESLRELNNLWIFRNFMPDLEEENEDFLEILDLNYRRSMDDLLFRYTDEKLPEKEGNIFIRLSETDIRRRGPEIVAMFERSATNKTYIEDWLENIETELREGYENFGYSYGELLHSIYCIGRLQIYDKRLIHVILAMYSLTLTKIFYRYKYALKRDDLENLKNRNYIMLRLLLGKSVAGSWAQNMMPLLVSGQMIWSEGGCFAGAAKACAIDDVEYKVTDKLDSELDKIYVMIDRNRRDKNKKEKYRKKIAVVVNKLEDLFLLTLFLSYETVFELRDTIRVQRADSSSEINIMQEDKENVNSLFEVNFLGEIILKGTLTYNVMNFINNIFMLEDRVLDFIKAVDGMIRDYDSDQGMERREKFKEIGELDENDYMIICEEIKKNKGFYRSMFEWTKEYGGMVVPAYSTDMYYNLIKRLARNQRGSNRKVVEYTELYDCFRELLEEIERQLQKNDEYYKDSFFGEAFENCPFIKKIRNLEEKEIEQYNSFTAQILDRHENIWIKRTSRADNSLERLFEI